MKFKEAIPIVDIAHWIGAEIIGDKNQYATGINEIHKVTPGDITFSDLEKYFEKALQSEASIIILNAPTECPPGKTILIVEEPFQAYNKLVWRFCPFVPVRTSVHPTAKIHPSVILEPNVVIGPEVEIGEDSHIQANATIYGHSILGARVTIQPNCIIGSDAFYYKRYPDHFEKWRTCGRVIIGDDVEIGAGCTVDRGVSGDTVIGTGTKMDCQIHIGHGAVIGKHCLLAAQVGVGGKTIIGDHVVLYGQVGVAQNLTIGDRAVIYAKSGVSKNLEGGKTYFGSPASEIKEKYKELAALRMLPDFLKNKV